MLRALSVVAILAAPLQAQQPAPIRGFPADQLAAQVRRETLARAIPSRDTLRAIVRLLSAVPHEAGTERSRHVAELLLARFRALGLDAHIEQFEALMPRPVRPDAGAPGTEAVHGESERARAATGSHDRPARSAPHVQRVLSRRRRDGGAGVRELRPAGRLPRAGQPGHQRQGKDRDRPLRAVVARHQAEGGGGARRHRLPHLFRPQGRRLLRWTTCTPRARCAPAAACSAAA